MKFNDKRYINLALEQKHHCYFTYYIRYKQQHYSLEFNPYKKFPILFLSFINYLFTFILNYETN